jgi:hypothetical protein
MPKVFTGPPETKVALPAFAGLVTSLVAQILNEYAPGVKAPSTTLVALAVTLVYGIVGYLAPHTQREIDPVIPPPKSPGLPGSQSMS